MAIDRLQYLLLVVCAVAAIMISNGCGNTERIDDRLDLADSLMESRPDSALLVLDEIEEGQVKGRERLARFALLKSMALDKNYIDTTTFDVLQPAIDYYLKNGSPNDRMKTYYYKGRIYENAGEDDLAMQSFLSGRERSRDVTDTLTLARLLIAQAALFYKQYRISDFLDNNLEAADLFGKLGMLPQQMRSYERALNGAVSLLNKPMADSIADICESMIRNDSSLVSYACKPLFSYSIIFNQDEKVRETIKEIHRRGVPEEMCFNLARAYSKIGEPESAIKYLEETKISADDILDSLSYWILKTDILESIGEDGMALDAFKNYSRLLEVYHDGLFSNELLFSEKKHEMEVENMAKIRKRDHIIMWISMGAAVLLILAILIYYRYRMNKAGRIIAERNSEKLKLETDNLRLEGENQRLQTERLESEGRELRLKNENLQLEQARFQLEAENLRLEAKQLEDERERLEELLKHKDALSQEGRRIVRERIEMLNGLFAKALTNEENYGKEFQKYVEKIKKNKDKFQKSIGQALEATHPAFMSYLRNHGLTEREIGYVCLYAIGLRGKEIGSYLDLARHYNISTDVRRKLGLDTNGENLGPFIRKLMKGECHT